MSFLNPRLGIDLGTTYVLVYVPKRGVIINEPSVIAIDQQNNIRAVGEEAKQMLGRTPDEIKVHKPMKDGVIADYKTTEVMIHYFITKALGPYSVFRPEVVVSVPAGSSGTERRAVVEAAKKAGAKEVHIVKEPILAAMGAGIPIQESIGHMIVDIGGGTTDVAVISLGGVVKCSSVKCAGNRIDHAIIDYMKKSANLQIGEKTAESIKINVASAIPLEEELSMDIVGRDLLTDLPKVREVRTNEINSAINKELNEMISAIKGVFQETRPELVEDIMEKGIIMTGGSSQLRNLQELVKKKTGVFANLADQSQYCVAYGTGIILKYINANKTANLVKR